MEDNDIEITENDSEIAQKRQRVTKAQLRRRINKVYKLLLQGWTYTDLIQFSSKEWGISPRQTSKYIAAATKEIEETAIEVRQNAFNELLASHKEMKKTANSAMDLRLVLDIDKEDAKLLGLYAASKNFNLDIDLSSLTDEQLIAIRDGADILEVLRQSSEDGG